MTTLSTLLNDVLDGSVMTDKAKVSMSQIITILNQLFLDKQSSLVLSQTKHFMWRGLDPAVHGRWLTRETDRYPSCANG